LFGNFNLRRLKEENHGPTAQNKHGAHYAGLVESDESTRLKFGFENLKISL
jgi:hypothetical protein